MTSILQIIGALPVVLLWIAGLSRVFTNNVRMRYEREADTPKGR